MMVMPTKESREMRNIIDPWVLYDSKKEKHYLNPKAPESIRKIYQKYREDNELEDFWDA